MILGGREDGRDEVPFEEYDVKLFELGEVAERQFREEGKMGHSAIIERDPNKLADAIDAKVRADFTASEYAEIVAEQKAVGAGFFCPDDHCDGNMLIYAALKTAWPDAPDDGAPGWDDFWMGDDVAGLWNAACARWAERIINA